mmetsp:Transcript_14722/g.46215  ORF Transcript_14722/g.46215 Transcript_14722/m.46215 type:complete len:133 (+) Transcript_14722:317-715(+)|eukprot:CAMPEP_0170737472 /NCGR_PEP_ID=MMETSP0437-20130122/4142_1 /TAXON_ID=0 /ORGANISM="Sexangularia sp." /LENGTH=132 /DNA_ID=CAMNT_0011075855 /DNA_START=236 /DNA_END=634 /DNA_ORIENTATION=+
MPEETRKIYDEAASIMTLSPRGACALLRLCGEKLCKHLNPKVTGNFYQLIGQLTDQGDQEGLDLVRAVGNEAVHGIDLFCEVDDLVNVDILFKILNTIVAKHISHPKELSKARSSLENLRKRKREDQNTRKE